MTGLYSLKATHSSCHVLLHWPEALLPFWNIFEVGFQRRDVNSITFISCCSTNGHWKHGTRKCRTITQQFKCTIRWLQTVLKNWTLLCSGSVFSSPQVLILHFLVILMRFDPAFSGPAFSVDTHSPAHQCVSALIWFTVILCVYFSWFLSLYDMQTSRDIPPLSVVCFHISPFHFTCLL